MIKRAKKFLNEEGNSFLLFIFLMPVLCGAFGLGLDAALGQYTRQGIQDAADISTLAGANQTEYAAGSNKRIISEAAAAAKVKELYLEKRKAYPNITGSEPTITVQITTGRWASTRLLAVTVQEKSPTIFLHIVGVSEFTYNISSQARLGYVNDR